MAGLCEGGNESPGSLKANKLQKLEEKRQKAERRKKREEKRKQKQIMKMKEKEAREMNLKIAIEERKLLIAQRKLESIRLLDELFERVKDKDKINKDKLQDKERELRNKLVKKYKSVQEQQLEEQREKLLQTIEGKNKLRSVLASTSKKPDTAEQSSGSSDSSSEEDSSNSTELTSHRETSWKEKQDFDGKKYHFVSQYKDRYWYQSKHYFEDTQSYMYPYDDRGGPALHSDFFKTYHNQRFPPNMRFNHRGGFYPRRRGFYVPRWQRNSRGGQGYRNFAAQGFSSDSFYYDDVTNDYYRYFQKLAKGKRNDASDATSEDTLSVVIPDRGHFPLIQGAGQCLGQDHTQSLGPDQDLVPGLGPINISGRVQDLGHKENLVHDHGAIQKLGQSLETDRSHVQSGVMVSRQEVQLENIGETVIFQWVEKVRELLQQLQLQASSEEEECVVDLPTECSDTKTKSTAGPEIIHGDTITDRKSVFQGHAAFVFSAEEVSLVLEELYKNKKVANATHNIYAYRIYKEDTKCSVQDCNDDGEAQAGGRLLHLLQILGLQNVMVVVTRWYGGVHLGPDRFRHINNAARQVLDLAGLIESANQPKKGKKKNS
ncbi:hypothetical protein ANN_12608 [Periplaneta americana]|uniref:Impact N-terminal domain-containing protein n=1 Tax=Periplaneta americana TaxID=6978 RepID=A0ABQ8TJK0_PERAM|nr:hypothetical protein ANN_12608 [Periplaneta americana]